ncbi:MAG TPA: hypothetical protein EYG97_00055 [Arcobacter sp.]|nr:hypothetical protein [Arcobacter sp.]HIP55400.1 hypothetical protein [Arcobacter sp.]
MTQEELDALMNSENLDDMVVEEKKEEKSDSEATKDNMAGQLSSITVDSEKKATEIMTMLDQVLVELDASETCIKEKSEEKALIIVDDIRNIVFEIMSTMQYQDIHRQKIERVMNTMIDISQMMATTLSGVASIKAPEAKHIDDSDGEAVNEDELAELIASMGKN